MDRHFFILRYLKFRNIQNRLTYLRWYNFIEKSQWWSKEENDNHQWTKVKLLLDYSYKNIPYYKEMFLKMGATPNDIKTWSDFSKIPYLTKEIVRNRTTDLTAYQKINMSKLRVAKTSGTTGEPLLIYKMPDSDAIERAFIYQQWKRVGYNENDTRIILRGEPVKNHKLFQRYRFTNDWLVSSYHLSRTYIKEYVDFLNWLKPAFFHVYPSSLYIFTQLLLESKLSLNFVPKAILSGSEPVYDYQRELFEKTYNTRVYSWLGLAESTTLAGECEHSISLHVWPQYSYVELLDEKGLPVDEKGCVGSIIGTTFNSLQTPFIRYRSGDLATYGGPQCNLCGRQHLIFDQVEGREQLFLILADGSELPFRTLGFYIKKNNAYKRIKVMQMIQNVSGDLLVKLSTTKDFTIDDEAEIRAKICSIVNNQLVLNFEYTDDFIRSKSGKNIEFIQRMKRSVD
ncbi:MAG: hypothetical protein MUO72_10085 [Bacteroidales bacterium]|nr:hypothetical protein [Bacteroidales bacterium]